MHALLDPGCASAQSVRRPLQTNSIAGTRPISPHRLWCRSMEIPAVPVTNSGCSMYSLVDGWNADVLPEPPRRPDGAKAMDPLRPKCAANGIATGTLSLSHV